MPACTLLSLLLALLLAAHPAAACPPGSGGPNCSFSLRYLFGEHAPRVWKGGRLAPLDLHGWNSDPLLYSRLLRHTNASFVVEVGVWKGASSIEFAKWLRSQGRGVVVSVDPFTGSLEHWLRNDKGWIHPDMQMPMIHGRPALYRQFRSNVRHLQLQQYVVPFPVTSRLAADFFSAKGLQADLIHLDAGHGYADVKEDLRLWYPNLRPGGCLLADDYTSGWPGVVQALDEFVAAEGLQLRNNGTKAWFYKPAGSVAAGGTAAAVGGGAAAGGLVLADGG
jgi:hypothetical protein